MTRFNTLLLIAVLVSALGVITAQHRARKLFQAMDAEREHARQLDVEHGQLQLELSTWATSARIEKIGRERLRMRLPEPTGIVTAIPGGDR
jgi:cell division protein FtsL